MEELYEFIKEIAKADDDVLVKVYGMSNLRYIIQDNSLKELYDKWYEYQKSKQEVEMAYNTYIKDDGCNG